MNNFMWDEGIIIFVTLVAWVLNLACHNDKNIRESVIMTAGRRLIMIAQLIVIYWLTTSLIMYGDSSLTKPGFFAFLMWALGSSMMSLDHIARRWGREISELLKPHQFYERRKHPR